MLIESKILKMSIFLAIVEPLILIVPALLSVAFVTIGERKGMAYMQRRLGPNSVGFYGLLQAFADALKLLLKEYIAPTQANITLFFFGPMVTLIFALLGFLVVPVGSGLFITDYNLGMLYALAVSSLGTYGILLAGWSANSKYAFVGSLRSTAQLISYELILSSIILIVIFASGSLSMITIVESQRAVNFALPLLPLFIIFFIGSIAETNRPPFDLAEAESELVSGFMTEHSASIFVFFFLAEYGSIVLLCMLNAILFFGGYLSIIPTSLLFDVLHSVFGIEHSVLESMFSWVSSSPLNLILKTILLVFTFIWARASFPRIRYDQLMKFCWTIILPLIIGYVFFYFCLIISLDGLPSLFLL